VAAILDTLCTPKQRNSPLWVMYGWVRRETGDRLALEIRRLWGFECDPAGRCNTNIAGARFRVIPSVRGHMAGSGINPPDSKVLSAEMKAQLAA
jgi:hypothetical protein